MHWTRPVVAVMCLVCVLVCDALMSEASAQWQTDGVEWWFNPGSGQRMPGKCLGNCGVDCIPSFNRLVVAASPTRAIGRWR